MSFRVRVLDAPRIDGYISVNVLEAITCDVKPGNAFEASVTARCIFCISSAMRQFPPRRIVCLTEETVETLYLLGEQDRIVGVSGYAVRPPQVRREKPRVSAFISADIPKILALEPDLVLAFSDLQADIVADLVRAGVAIHVFNQRDIAGILAMIRTLGALVGAAARADQLATRYEKRLATKSRRSPGARQNQRSISRSGTIP